MNIDLSGHKALVCGASQGIGAAIAMELAKAGAQLTLVARNESNLNTVLADLDGSYHIGFPCDFSKNEEVEKLTIMVKNGNFDIIINNTGGPAPGPITSATTEQFEKALSMHLLTNHRIVQAALENMKSKGFGRIVNIISTSVKIPIDGLGVSNTTRGAVASWAKTLSNEIAQFGITVNNILPGLTKTARLDSLIQKLATEQGISFEEMERKMIDTIPARRFADPSEIGDLAVFLCSKQAGYINGTSIRADGGKTGSI